MSTRQKLIKMGMLTFLAALAILFLSGENAAMGQKDKEIFGAKGRQIDNIPNTSKVANELVYQETKDQETKDQETKDKWVVVTSIVSLIVISILVVITAWYAHSTSRMLKEMQRQAHLMTISIAASVEAGILSMPGPGKYSRAQHDAYHMLEYYRGKINKLLEEFEMPRTKKGEATTKKRK